MKIFNYKVLKFTVTENLKNWAWEAPDDLIGQSVNLWKLTNPDLQGSNNYIFWLDGNLE